MIVDHAARLRRIAYATRRQAEMAGNPNNQRSAQILDEAADEIERLRLRVAELEGRTSRSVTAREGDTITISATPTDPNADSWRWQIFKAPRPTEETPE